MSKRETAAISGLTDRASQAYERLRALIIHGQLAPGTLIVETDLAERLGVSRTPARSALQRLQQEGFVTEPREGRHSRPIVSPLTRRDAGEIFSIVGLLEGMAAMDAARAPGDERSSLVSELRIANEGLNQLAHETDVDRGQYFDRDHGFHQILIKEAGPRLRGLHAMVKPQAERYIRLYVTTLPTEVGTSVREHDEIVQAIEAGAPDAARRFAERNWHNAAQRLYRVIDRVGELGYW